MKRPPFWPGRQSREEKQMIAGWIQEEIPDGEDWDEDYQRRALGGLWLTLMADSAG